MNRVYAIPAIVPYQRRIAPQHTHIDRTYAGEQTSLRRGHAAELFAVLLRRRPVSSRRRSDRVRPDRFAARCACISRKSSILHRERTHYKREWFLLLHATMNARGALIVLYPPDSGLWYMYNQPGIGSRLRGRLPTVLLAQEDRTDRRSAHIGNLLIYTLSAACR